VGRLFDDFKWSPGRVVGDLWREVADGTIVWGDPTPAQVAARRERRARLFEESRVPWIVQDIGGLLGFYDDIQDIVSFTRWNKRIFSPKRIAQCMRRQGKKGRSGAAAVLACFCPVGRKGKRDAAKVADKAVKQVGPGLTAALGKLFPFLNPLMYPLLALQVSATLFGVGISLGPAVGAALEGFFRGLDAVGLPFGPEHNKYHQLKRARVLQGCPKLVGSWPHTDWEDRLTSLLGMQFAWRDTDILPEVVLQPEDYPRIEELVTDPFDTFKSVAGMGLSLLPNAASYLVDDFFEPIVGDVARLLGGEATQAYYDPAPWTKAALAFIEKGKCPAHTACTSSVEDAITVAEWGRAHSLQRDAWTGIISLGEAWAGPTVILSEGEGVEG